MERTVAVKRLHKMLGKEFAYRIDNKAPSKEERHEAREHVKELAERKTAAHNALVARREELFKDPEYQSLLAAWREADRTVSHNGSNLHRFRFTVGTSDRMFFHVKASGDSWEEIFDKLKQEGRRDGGKKDD